MNGNMLAQLRKIEEGKEKVPQTIVNQLVVTGMINITDELKSQGERIQAMDEKLDHILENIGTVAENKKAINEIRESYLFRISEFIKGNPKTSLMIFLFVFTSLNMWFISDIRKAILEYFTGYTDLLKLLGL